LYVLAYIVPPPGQYNPIAGLYPVGIIP